MSGSDHTYTYQHLLRFGQTMLATAVYLAGPALLVFWRGAIVEAGIFVDTLLVGTLLAYVVNYRHLFGGSLRLTRSAIRFNRLLLPPLELDWQDIRRISFRAQPATFLGYLAGPRLTMVIAAREVISVQVSDLQDADRFVEQIYQLADRHAVRVNWMDGEGKIIERSEKAGHLAV